MKPAGLLATLHAAAAAHFNLAQQRHIKRYQEKSLPN